MDNKNKLIDELNLSKKIKTELKAIGFRTVGDIVDKGFDELYSNKQKFTFRGLTQIENCLSDFGFELREIKIDKLSKEMEESGLDALRSISADKFKRDTDSMYAISYSALNWIESNTIKNKANTKSSRDFEKAKKEMLELMGVYQKIVDEKRSEIAGCNKIK